MSLSYNRIPVQNASEEIESAFKNRIRMLVLVSSLAVALMFGLTFYFALLSTESAVAKQVPELETLVQKLKSLLVVNTLVFATIIIASFYLLTLLITSRMFNPLGLVKEGLSTIADGRLPETDTAGSDSPFSGIEQVFIAAVDSLHAKEKKEIDVLTMSENINRDPRKIDEANAGITALIKEKQSFIGIDTDDGSEPKTGEESNNLFMQPL